MGDEVLRLRDMAEEVNNLDQAQFIEAHGNAFLLCHLSELMDPGGPIKTWAHGNRIRVGHPGTLDCLVFPLRRREGSLSENKVTVGRTANNDICIRDGTVSKFHALIAEENNGALRVLDAGSEAGTFLDNDPVPDRRRGPGAELSPGDTLRFGSVDTTFLDGPSFFALLRRLAKRL